VEREQRKSKFCNTNSIENEYHFLLVCLIYIELRRTYFRAYFCRWPTLNKIDQIMSSKNKIQVNMLTKFIYDALKSEIAVS